MEFTCTTEQRVQIGLAPMTATQETAAMDRPPEISVGTGDGTFRRVDERSYWLIPGELEGDTEYEILAMSKGRIVREIVTLHVVNPSAATLGVTSLGTYLKE